ncbi:MAG: hypothetical protein WGN25_05670 [Candidatus Electrothrix sp. GW3-4]|uniref:hypothetical protein n=1 Tax=Candidatus Electrothrix sp. GW3-4 TaxID=3126740 RepID=UPI0030D56A71
MKIFWMVTFTCFLFVTSLTTKGYAQDTDKSLWKAQVKQFIEDRTDIANKLESCEVYDKKIRDPFINIFIDRDADSFIYIRIKGIIDDRCVYAEEFIGNMQFECKYSEEQRKAVASYYRKLMKQYSKQLAKDGSVTLEYDANNPMNIYMNDGTCSISLVNK